MHQGRHNHRFARVAHTKYKMHNRSQEAVNFIHPHRFNTPQFQRRAILAGINSEVDSWNSIIQKMNPKINQKRHILSADRLAEVDDPRGILRDMLT